MLAIWCPGWASVRAMTRVPANAAVRGAQEWHLAQDRLVNGSRGPTRQNQQSARPLPAHQGPPRRQEGHGGCLTAAYHMLRDGVEYADPWPGPDYFDRHHAEKTRWRSTSRR